MCAALVCSVAINDMRVVCRVFRPMCPGPVSGCVTSAHGETDGGLLLTPSICAITLSMCPHPSPDPPSALPKAKNAHSIAFTPLFTPPPWRCSHDLRPPYPS